MTVTHTDTDGHTHTHTLVLSAKKEKVSDLCRRLLGVIYVGHAGADLGFETLGEGDTLRVAPIEFRLAGHTLHSSDLGLLFPGHTSLHFPTSAPGSGFHPVQNGQQHCIPPLCLNPPTPFSVPSLGFAEG